MRKGSVRVNELELKGKMSLCVILCSHFHYETYIGISPYRTLAVAGTAIYGSYVIM